MRKVYNAIQKVMLTLKYFLYAIKCLKQFSSLFAGVYFIYGVFAYIYIF